MKRKTFIPKGAIWKRAQLLDYFLTNLIGYNIKVPPQKISSVYVGEEGALSSDFIAKAEKLIPDSLLQKYADQDYENIENNGGGTDGWADDDEMILAGDDYEKVTMLIETLIKDL